VSHIIPGIRHQEAEYTCIISVVHLEVCPWRCNAKNCVPAFRSFLHDANHFHKDRRVSAQPHCRVTYALPVDWSGVVRGMLQFRCSDAELPAYLKALHP
jgi:hypothetical protein